MTIQELADQAYSYFTKDIRADGATEYWYCKDGTPEWVHELVQASHDNCEMLPDDFRYEYIVDALADISESDDPDDPCIEPEIYNGRLLKWLASHLSRVGYVDDAVEELGRSDNGILGDIALGNLREKEEVYWAVLNFLKERLEEGEKE
jgi:hypothetical protein